MDAGIYVGFHKGKNFEQHYGIENSEPQKTKGDSTENYLNYLLGNE